MNPFDQVVNWRSEEIHTVMSGPDGFNRSLNNLYGGVTMPQNPGLGENNWSSPHQDSYCSESVGLHGPTYKTLKLIKQYNPYGFTPTMVCNANNQMIGMSFAQGEGQYRLVIFDEDCNIISATKTSTLVPNSFGGGYFYLNQDNNTVVIANNCISCYPTADVAKREEVYSIDPLWQSEDIINLVTGSPDNNSLYSALPVWNDNTNLYWCLIAGQYDFTPPGSLVSNAWIAVVEITPDASQPGGCRTVLRDALELENQWNNNTFAVDQDGAYFVTNALDEEGRCNRGFLHCTAYDAASGKVSSRYAAPYENSGMLKPGQTNIGSGTTPTLTDTEDGQKLVAITDNAYPQVHVSVYNRDTGEPVANVPVFAKMRGCDEASLIGVNNRFVVENNFGHTVDYPRSQYVSNEPGMALVEIGEDVNKDPVIWENNNTCYFAMNMLARESGLIFAHTGDWFDDHSSDKGGMYSICAMDSWDGRIIWRITLGRGLQYCHEYGGIYFNRKGDSVYMGTNSYLVCIKDSRD